MRDPPGRARDSRTQTSCYGAWVVHPLVVLLLPALFAGCGDDGAPRSDAATDAMPARDSGPTSDAGRDAGPVCAEACAFPAVCCPGTGGIGECVDRARDDSHCGACGNACSEGRGTRCVNASCACGASDLGCSGARSDWCCPAREDGGMPYCANLFTGALDCGACGQVCLAAQSDRCDGARCLCGLGRTACAGTPEDTCCPVSAGEPMCVDMRSDRLHCGACVNACAAVETCTDGTCSRGSTPCVDGCAVGNVCCDGVCCPRVSCERGLCAVDAGM